MRERDATFKHVKVADTQYRMAGPTPPLAHTDPLIKCRYMPTSPLRDLPELCE